MEYYLGNTKINEFWLGNTQINNIINEFYSPPGTPLIYVNPNYEPSGSTVTNFGSSGVNGSLADSVSYSSTGIKRYDFDAGRIVFNDAGDPLENLTVAFWTKPAGVGAMVYKWNDEGSQRSVGVRRTSPSFMNFYASRDGSASDWMNAAPSFTLSTTDWWYILFRYDGSTGNFYSSVGTSSYDNGFTLNTNWAFGGSGSIFDNAEPWAVGQEHFFSSWTNSYSGSMGHIFIYNDYLSDTDVENIYEDTKAHYGY